VVLARGANVAPENLPDYVTERPVMLVRAVDDASGAAATAEDTVFKIRVGTPLAEVEQRLLEETLRLTKGNKTLTAKMLGIDPKTVFRKLKASEAEESAAENAAERPAAG
jgi:DNA-binding NtrC family response regulator